MKGSVQVEVVCTTALPASMYREGLMCACARVRVPVA
jgi:hypothetical protein